MLETLQPVDISAFLESPTNDVTQELGSRVAACLRETGCIVVRDPRVDMSDNSKFVDMMENYFSRPTESKKVEERPSLHYQVGVTPSGKETPRVLVDPAWRRVIEEQPPEARATMPQRADVKWRYMWRIGERPANTTYAELNSPPVIPEGMAEFSNVMDSWGSKVLDTVLAVAELAAVGLGLPADAFTSRMQYGPHVLAPTGTDLELHNKLGTVYAGFHYDLNFMTIHGKCRFPGLFVWLRDGRRVAVRIPEGCLLIQAGKQLEWLTGGAVQAGTHEVVCTPDTLEAIETAKKEGRKLWRVSSTLFSHIASDQTLAPLGDFADDTTLQKYPATPAGEQVQAELKLIKLKHDT